MAVTLPSKGKPSFIRSVHRGPITNYVFPTLTGVQYATFIDVNFGYHNLKLDEKSLYLTNFACQVGWCRYFRPSFRAAVTGDMFRRKM